MRYYLAESCQNTFVLFDCLGMANLSGEFIKKAHSLLSNEKRDDALILIAGQLTDQSLSAQMIVLGLDGNFGEFCGNGARAAAAYLFAHYPFSKTISLKTKLGLHELFHKGGHQYSVKLLPACFAWNSKFVTEPPQGEFVYVEIIEPHLVINKKMDDEELIAIGKALNKQKELFPLGINVNAWHVLKEGEIFVKTYERGVQRLTRSCGTGSIACAAHYRGKGIVLAATPGGPLEITFGDHEVELCGESLITKTIGLL